MPPQTIKIDPASIQPISDVKIDPNSITPLDDLKQAPSQQFADHPGEYLENAGIGALKGAGHTASAIGRVLFPDWAAKMAGMTPPSEAQHESYYAPKNDAQGMGRALEQIGEFFIPGPAEEAGAAKLAELMPTAGKFADPLAHVLTSALSSGAVNAAQGGGFGTGAAMGAGGAAVGQGLKAVAPTIAETALRIGKKERAFGKNAGSIGHAVLEDTSGFRPEKVERTGRETIENLAPQLESMARDASVRPAPRVRGFLMPPQQEVELARHPAIEPRESPMAFRAQSHQGTPRVYNQTQFQSGGAHPELSGRVEQPQGVVFLRPEMSASEPPTLEPNPSVSMRPARAAIGVPMGEAARNEASGLHNQLSDMSDFLHQGRVSGEPIPENVTPVRALQLRRGFTDEHLGKWNPETHAKAIAAGRKAYHALTEGFHAAVPGSEAIDDRISNLIPAVRKAESVSREAPFLQRVAGRFGAHTGALAGAGIGGYFGGRNGGGIEGAAKGAALGLFGPELIFNPEGQMAIARAFNSPAVRRVILPAATGAVLQTTRRKP